jgi:hypothetical protein
MHCVLGVAPAKTPAMDPDKVEVHPEQELLTWCPIAAMSNLQCLNSSVVFV